jgi:topoisomerase-4 subunit B
VTLGEWGAQGTADEFNKLMGKGEAAARRELMERFSDEIEVDI